MRQLMLVTVLLFVVSGLPVQAGEESMQAPSPSGQPSAAEQPPIDLNTADRQALESLPGVGPRTAELIIEYRTEAGGFKKVEDLMNVRGIGETTFLRIRELVRVEASGDRR